LILLIIVLFPNPVSTVFLSLSFIYHCLFLTFSEIKNINVSLVLKFFKIKLLNCHFKRILDLYLFFNFFFFFLLFLCWGFTFLWWFWWWFSFLFWRFFSWLWPFLWALCSGLFFEDFHIPLLLFFCFLHFLVFLDLYVPNLHYGTIGNEFWNNRFYDYLIFIQ